MSKLFILIFFILFNLIFKINGNYEQPKNEYENDENYSNGYEVKFGQGRRIIDNYICDMDASVLVVTNSDNSYKKSSGYAQEEGYEKQPPYAPGYEKVKRTKRSEYGEQKKYKNYGNTYKVSKAHRLRCSIIASGSDDDCRKCCHMAARKERSIAKDSIFGFIVDYDELNLSYYAAAASGYLQTPSRSKRDIPSPSPAYTPPPPNTDYKPASEYKQPAAAAAPAVSPPAYTPAINYQNYYNYQNNNPRCVCCSPRVYSVHQEYENNNNYGKKKQYESGEYKRKEYDSEYNNKGDYNNEEYEKQQRGYEEHNYGTGKYINYEEPPKPQEYQHNYETQKYNNYEELTKPQEYHQQQHNYEEKSEYYYKDEKPSKYYDGPKQRPPYYGRRHYGRYSEKEEYEKK